jgi:hypothetical protein
MTFPPHYRDPSTLKSRVCGHRLLNSNNGLTIPARITRSELMLPDATAWGLEAQPFDVRLFYPRRLTFLGENRMQPSSDCYRGKKFTRTLILESADIQLLLNSVVHSLKCRLGIATSQDRKEDWVRKSDDISQHPSPTRVSFYCQASHHVFATPEPTGVLCAQAYRVLPRPRLPPNCETSPPSPGAVPAACPCHRNRHNSAERICVGRSRGG